LWFYGVSLLLGESSIKEFFSPGENRGDTERKGGKRGGSARRIIYAGKEKFTIKNPITGESGGIE
jgi:hypothetical protein